ncbi:MAG: phosphoribosylformylglycinamidine synthase [Planctomycetota bacterium]|nr:MAG: phosphoribosylformylglycinamidine synthase [Planctomycetota bacterium]
MTAPHALVLKAPGTNCDFETLDALERAGATTELVTTHVLFAEAERLLRARILCFPGGFAHGDDIASARVLAGQMRHRLGDTLLRFVEQEGGYILGICNGFQALVKLGLLPRMNSGSLQQEVSLVHNASGQYECRWVRLRVEDSHCAFLPKGMVFEMPVGHGEGKFVASERFDAGRSKLVALRYLDAEGSPTQDYPYNPNGSTHAVAGLTDPSGRVLGLMPHPDRSYLAAQHPRRLHQEIRDEDMAGHQLFSALVEAAKG